ncbi:MAG: AraC family transcriptional regulator [Chitinophagaceae bacterium]
MSVEQLSFNNAAIAIRDFIDANPLSKKTPSELAANFDVDRYKVLPAFKTLTGDTIQHYQLERLIHTASEMLLSGMMVKEVGIECGYMDYPTNFTRSFRKVFEMGPDEWVRNKLFVNSDSKANEQS